MYTGTRARDWDETATHGAAIVQRVEAGLPWEQDAERGRADQDGWLLSFVDVLTLLLTLFVLLLAYQHGAGERAEEAARGRTQIAPLPDASPPQRPVLRTAAAAEPARDETRALLPDDLALLNPWQADWMGPLLTQVAQADVSAGSEAADVNGEPEQLGDRAAPPDTGAVSRDPLDRLLEELNEPGLQGRVEVTRQPGGLDLEISDSILFTPASAALTVGGRALLDELAGVLASLPYELSVEGHTDDRPIATERFPSNWELASARASGVTRHLIGQGIAAGRVRAIGYADTRPRADNASAEGRARNRRVSFILRLPAS